MPETEFRLTPHETLELHELLGNRITMLKKLNVSKTSVRNSALTGFIDDAIDRKTVEIREIQDFLDKRSPDTMQ
ncbi:Hypothetical protein DEACI_0963 [Acididesulfobacillus acetoxydans]|uniref:Uncharacterized protein n=1 Tax=Acididesulfobacillus acetoxydans TaxID=1561005 RepID=A0A8S0X3Q8_9FIRM|nr:hypothetical protein [Acididesulfobacillus acetoxydans]CAA7600310.1 Hypothetical protein DEACI_0963 [Acididesulfobacillus acetoxydans]CEJ06086.1 Hypothetical protein DEACI_0532 [Acididesulfobacillus acetoxydans]